MKDVLKLVAPTLIGATLWTALVLLLANTTNPFR